MAVRLYVGNLPYNATEAELREHFSAVGPVAGVWIATDRETGRPRGFAFVEFEDRAVAEEAVRRFNSKPFGGRPLAVNEARPQERGGAPPPRRTGPPPSDRPRFGGGHDAAGSDAPPRPRPPFRPPSSSPEPGFFPDAEPARRTRDAAPRKKKERERGRDFDKVRPPKQRPIQVASGGRFFSSDDFDEDDAEGTGLNEEIEGDLEGTDEGEEGEGDGTRTSAEDREDEEGEAAEESEPAEEDAPSQ